MDKQCKKCSVDIDTKGELYTICEGKCARRFHATCVGISEAALCILSKNILWMCDECAFDYYRARDTVPDKTEQPASLVNELEELKSQVSKINDAIANITLSITPSVPIERHSTPATSPKTLENVNACSTRINADETFSLLLTNIDRCVTEKEIAHLVSCSLCASEDECMDVKKLVPNWKNCEDLDYISFKIVLDKRWKAAAMMSTTWPQGVRFREFVNRRNDTWKPTL